MTTWDRDAVVFPGPPVCNWWVACTNPATHTQPHPVLGEVPICDRCQAKLDSLK